MYIGELRYAFIYVDVLSMLWTSQKPHNGTNAYQEETISELVVIWVQSYGSITRMQVVPH